MKKYIAFLLITFPFAVTAQDQQGFTSPSGLYTDRLTYEIVGPQGAVVDSTVYTRNIGLPYADAMVLKYVRLLRCVGSETNTFLDVLKTIEGGGTVLQLLEEDIKN